MADTPLNILSQFAFPAQGAQGAGFPWLSPGDTPFAVPVCQPGPGTIIHLVPVAVAVRVPGLELAEIVAGEGWAPTLVLELGL